MMAPLAALEGMQTKAGDIHALRAGTSIEGGEDAQEFRGVPLGNSRRSALPIEFPQAAMPECIDHWLNVWCLSTIVNHDAALEVHRVHPRRHLLQTLGHRCLRQHRRSQPLEDGARAVNRAVVGA